MNTLNQFYAEQIANRIIDRDGEVHVLKRDITHKALSALLMPLLSVSTIETGADIQYFDLSIPLDAIERVDATLLPLISVFDDDVDYDLVGELRALLSRASQEQIEDWKAALAECIDSDISQTIDRLLFLAENGEKVELIRNDSEFHFLSGYLHAVEQFAERL